jgi:hypothetical protein
MVCPLLVEDPQVFREGFLRLRFHLQHLRGIELMLQTNHPQPVPLQSDQVIRLLLLHDQQEEDMSRLPPELVMRIIEWFPPVLVMGIIGWLPPELVMGIIEWLPPALVMPIIEPPTLVVLAEHQIIGFLSRVELCQEGLQLQTLVRGVDILRELWHQEEQTGLPDVLKLVEAVPSLFLHTILEQVTEMTEEDQIQTVPMLEKASTDIPNAIVVLVPEEVVITTERHKDIWEIMG